LGSATEQRAVLFSFCPPLSVIEFPRQQELLVCGERLPFGFLNGPNISFGQVWKDQVKTLMEIGTGWLSPCMKWEIDTDGQGGVRPRMTIESFLPTENNCPPNFHHLLKDGH